MASLSSIKRILSESFPELKWMPQLLAPLNQFIEEMNRALNNEITVSQNMDGVVKDVVIDGTFPVKFKWTRQSKPRVAWIGGCRELSGTHITFTDPIFLDWEFAGEGFFKINGVPGLTATPTNKFNLTIVALTG